MRTFLTWFWVSGLAALVLIFIAALWGVRIVQWCRETAGVLGDRMAVWKTKALGGKK